MKGITLLLTTVALLLMPAFVLVQPCSARFLFMESGDANPFQGWITGVTHSSGSFIGSRGNRTGSYPILSRMGTGKELAASIQAALPPGRGWAKCE